MPDILSSSPNHCQPAVNTTASLIAYYILVREWVAKDLKLMWSVEWITYWFIVVNAFANGVVIQVDIR